MFAWILGITAAVAWPNPSTVKGVPPDIREALHRVSARDPVTLRWQAPDGCPTEAELRSAVDTRRAERLARRTRLQVAIDIGVQQRADGDFHADIWTTDDDGAHLRELDDGDCHALGVAVAYVVAMAIDVRVREQVEREREAASPSERPEPKPPTPPAAAPREDRPPTRRKIPLRGAFRVGAGIIYGDLPTVGPVVRATAALLAPRWRLEGEISYAAARNPRWRDGMDMVYTGTVEALTGLLRVCPVFRVLRAEIPLCAGFEAGTLMIRGASDGVRRAPFASVLASTGVLVELNRRVALAIPLVEGSVHVVRTTFAVGEYTVSPDPSQIVGNIGLLGVRVLTGIEVQFPR